MLLRSLLAALWLTCSVAAGAAAPTLDVTGLAAPGGTVQFSVMLAAPGPSVLVLDLVPGPTHAGGAVFGVGLSPAAFALSLATQTTGAATVTWTVPDGAALEDLTIFCEAIDLTTSEPSGAQAVAIAGKLPAVPASTLFFVDDASGDDAGAGTASAPWRTIQKAADSLPAGSTALIKSGVYAERVVVHVSGNASDGPVIFRADPAGTVVLDGGSFGKQDFAAWDGAFGEGLLDITDRTRVRVHGLEIRNLSTKSKKRFLMGVQVAKTAGDASPMERIELVDLNVHHVRYLGSSDAGGTQGIAVYGGNPDVAITDVAIVGCDVHDLRLGQSESMTLNGNVDGFVIADNDVHDNDNIGIVCIGWEGTAGGSQSGDDKNSNAAFYGGHHPNDRARNGTIAGNRVFRCSTDAPVKNQTYPPHDFSAGGIYIDGGRDVVIERNVVFECDIGIDVGCEHGGVDDDGAPRDVRGVVCRDNVVAFCGQAGVSIGGYNKFRGVAVDCAVVNNTIYKCSSLGWGGGQVSFAKSHDNLVANNVIVARGLADGDDYDGFHNAGAAWKYDHGVMIGSEVPAAFNHDNVLDHNLYFTADGLSKVYWKWQVGPNKDPVKGWDGLAAIDANAIFGDPLFAHASIGKSDGLEDLRLANVASPAVDSGDATLSVLGALDADGFVRIVGASVDRGAYEWGSHAP